MHSAHVPALTREVMYLRQAEAARAQVSARTNLHGTNVPRQLVVGLKVEGAGVHSTMSV